MTSVPQGFGRAEPEFGKRARHFDILIVGGSAAGLYTAKHVIDCGFDGSVGVISADPDEPYDRTRLSKELLFGDAPVSSVGIDGGRPTGCQWLGGTKAQGLDAGSSRVWTDTYGPIGFGRLVIASGARPRRLPSGAPSASAAHHLYTLSDALALRSRLGELTRATVVGSGFVAAEVASGLATAGIDVRMVVRGGLFARFGSRIQEMAECLFARHGVTVAREAEGITGKARRSAADEEVDTGRDSAVIGAIGSEPAVQWLGEFARSRGSVIRTDAVGRVDGSTSIFAVGDVAWRRNSRHAQYIRAGHWASAIVDAQTTAAFLATGEVRHGARAGLQGYSSTHFGVTLQGIGAPSIADEVRCDGDYLAEGWAGSRFFREGALCAAVAYGRPAYVMQALPELLEAATS